MQKCYNPPIRGYVGEEVLGFVGIGVAAGIVAGLLGVGGGIITVPAMHGMLSLMGMPEEKNMIFSIGTSLAAMVFTSAASAWSHFRRQGIDVCRFRALLPGVTTGAFLGAFIAHRLPNGILVLLFGLSLGVISLRFLFPSEQMEMKNIDYIPQWIHPFVAVMIGSLSSLLGIGGGLLLVPYFKFSGLPLKVAIGTAAGLGFPISLTGALSLLVFGLSKPEFQGAVGYVYVPAFLIIALVSTFCAPIGARIAYMVPVPLLSRIFGMTLLIVALVMLSTLFNSILISLLYL